MASIVRTQTIAADDHYADAPAFADVVHVLTTPPPGYSWTPSNRVYHLSALFAYSLAHPLQFIHWAGDEFDVAGKMVKLVDGKASRKVQFGAHIARDLVCAPCGSPEMRSRQMLGHASRRPAPPSKGSVRIKWYPSAEAIRQWPKDLGELWMDLPFDADGGVDLRPAMRTWGMENCHILDANRGMPHVSRYPSERLSALAIKVLLDGHRVIGVVECPTPHMQAARQARTSVKQLPRQAAQLAGDALASSPAVLRRLVCAAPSFAFCTANTTIQVSLWTILGMMLLLFQLLHHPAQRLADIALPVIAVLAFPIFGVACACLAILWWLAKMGCAWTIAGLEVLFLTEEEIEDVERQRAAAREWAAQMAQDLDASESDGSFA